MQTKKTFLTVFITVMVTVLVMLAGILILPDKAVPRATLDSVKTDFDDWLEHTSPQGFSFLYPAGYVIVEVKDPNNSSNTIVHIVEADDKGQPKLGVVPSLEIDYSTESVSFSLWEGQGWLAFPKIVETFFVK